MTRNLAKRILQAMWIDLREGEEMVLMPRSLFEFIANQLEIPMPNTPITIITTPPRVTKEIFE
jgi:hypothetical protein